MHVFVRHLFWTFQSSSSDEIVGCVLNIFFIEGVLIVYLSGKGDRSMDNTLTRTINLSTTNEPNLEYQLYNPHHKP